MQTYKMTESEYDAYNHGLHDGFDKGVKMAMKRMLNFIDSDIEDKEDDFGKGFKCAVDGMKLFVGGMVNDN